MGDVKDRQQTILQSYRKTFLSSGVTSSLPPLRRPVNDEPCGGNNTKPRLRRGKILPLRQMISVHRPEPSYLDVMTETSDTQVNGPGRVTNLRRSLRRYYAHP